MRNHAGAFKKYQLYFFAFSQMKQRFLKDGILQSSASRPLQGGTTLRLFYITTE
jgi:hypothetical protein